MSNLKYISGDLDPSRAEEIINITGIPFGDESFEVVLCSHVLEHVVDDGKALAELKRVLVDGGWAVVQIPVDYQRGNTFEPQTASAQERLKLFGQVDHVRIYGRDVEERMKSAGFIVEVWDYSKLLNPKDVEMYGLEKDSIIYICKKWIDLCPA